MYAIGMTTTAHTKTGHVLPKEAVLALTTYATSREEQNAYMAALRQNHWTLQSIAGAVGLSRERVRQLIKEVPVEDMSVYMDVPKPPVKAVKPRRTYNEPDPEVLAELLELKPLVAQVRGNSQAFREEAKRFNELVWKTVGPVEDGGKAVPVYRLAKRLDVTHGAIRSRLKRYELTK